MCNSNTDNAPTGVFERANKSIQINLFSSERNQSHFIWPMAELTAKYNRDSITVVMKATAELSDHNRGQLLTALPLKKNSVMSSAPNSMAAVEHAAISKAHESCR